MLTYCDSSAFVVLLRPDERDREPLVTASIREASAVAAIDWICPLEVCAAVTRSLPARSRRAAERRWWDIWSRIVPVAVVDAIYEDALRVAREHRLRSLDALHLAAATRIGCARLLTFDVELAAAAREEKLDVVGV